jgi:hypothetical protein
MNKVIILMTTGKNYKYLVGNYTLGLLSMVMPLTEGSSKDVSSHGA